MRIKRDFDTNNSNSKDDDLNWARIERSTFFVPWKGDITENLFEKTEHENEDENSFQECVRTKIKEHLELDLTLLLIQLRIGLVLFLVAIFMKLF